MAILSRMKSSSYISGRQKNNFFFRHILPALLWSSILVPEAYTAEFSFSTKSLIASQNSSQTSTNFFFNRLRAQTHLDLSENCATELEYELFPAWIDSAALVSTISIKNSNTRIYRIADLNHSLTGKPEVADTSEHWQVEQNLDRALLRCQTGNWEYIIGRQAVNFGGMSVSPTDIFAPVSFKALDQEFRPGVDAFRIFGGFGETAEMEAGIIMGKDNASKNNGAYLRSHFLLGTTDLTPILAGNKKNQLLGLTLQADLGLVGLVIDGAMILQRRSNLETDEEVFKIWTPWTLGLNLQWSENLFTMIDFHHNPMGTEKPKNYLSNASSAIYQEFPISLLGRNYLLPTLTYQFSPLWSLSSSTFSNLNDGSSLNTSQLEWSISEDSLLSCSISFASGKRSVLPEEKQSEFGDLPNSFQLILKHYR